MVPNLLILSATGFERHELGNSYMYRTTATRGVPPPSRLSCCPSCRLSFLFLCWHMLVARLGRFKPQLESSLGSATKK